MKINHEIKGLILDMDGVLWRGDELLVDLPDFFSKLRNKNLQVILVSNNSTKSVHVLMQKLSVLGVQLEEWQILNSAEATAEYLISRFPNGGNIYIIGEQGLFETLHNKGFTTHSDQKIIAVIVGLDRNCTYSKIARASRLVKQGAIFIGTNPDITFPTPDGEEPGAGVLVSAVQLTSNVTPIVLGKPYPTMFTMALKRLNLLPGETLVIGDRLETDIAGGKAVGCVTALVMTGVTNEDVLNSSDIQPDYVYPNLNQLLAAL